LLVDCLAQQYGQLPSDILARADTFDLMVYDAGITYKRQLERKANKQPAEISDFSPKQINELSNRFYGKNAI